MEIAVWNECARLLTNAIIYYNAVLLTTLLEHYELSGQKEKCEFIKMLSPVAWVHINFYGQYSFMESEMIDIDYLLSPYKADEAFWVGKNAEIILAN